MAAGKGGPRQQFVLRAKFGLFTINKQAANYAIHIKERGEINCTSLQRKCQLVTKYVSFRSTDRVAD